MESMHSLDKLEIETNNVFYDKKTEVLSVFIFDFVFIGNYKKSTRIAKILDDIYKLFSDTQLKREDLSLVDFVSRTPIPEKTKLNKLHLISKKEKDQKDLQKVDIEELENERKEEEKLLFSKEVSVLEDKKLKKEKKREKGKAKRRPSMSPPKAQKRGDFTEETEETVYEEEDDYAKDESESMGESLKSMDYDDSEIAAPSIAPKAPGGAVRDAFAGGGAPRSPTEELIPDSVSPEEPKPQVYEINMGLQYYSVMMEQTSYLFYVYFSHKELKIIDEEGKTVFETSFKIETTKKEPPILDLRVEGDGFEVHPLYGKVEVKKDAVNPPVMIFSILPVKAKERTKKQKKEGERRFLNVYIDFEDKTISHTVLSIIVQPKHFHLDIGPLHFDISKRTAILISFVSVLIAAGSLIFAIFSIDPSSSFVDFVSTFAPGLGSIIFIIIFLVTLFKEGIYPLKEKIEHFLNFDKTGMLIK